MKTAPDVKNVKIPIIHVLYKSSTTIEEWQRTGDAPAVAVAAGARRTCGACGGASRSSGTCGWRGRRWRRGAPLSAAPRRPLRRRDVEGRPVGALRGRRGRRRGRHSRSSHHWKSDAPLMIDHVMIIVILRLHVFCIYLSSICFLSCITTGVFVTKKSYYNYYHYHYHYYIIIWKYNWRKPIKILNQLPGTYILMSWLADNLSPKLWR